jgi:hypothetical protein
MGIQVFIELLSSVMTRDVFGAKSEMGDGELVCNFQNGTSN